MKNKPKIGLHPLYLMLYDDSSPDKRIGAEAFHALIASNLADAGIDLVNVPVCRVKEEFDDAVSLFEVEGVDAIVTLNLSYSPSLEASYALARTALPLIVLGTTPDYVYDFDSSPSEIIYNQGISGVQDMCNMLHRSGKKFDVVMGHIEDGQFIDHVVTAVKAARLSRLMRTSKVGMIGEPFKAMGDFQLGGNKMKELLGIEVVKFDMAKYPEVSDDEVADEYRRDTAQYIMDSIGSGDYLEPGRSELIIRKWLRNKKLDAFTMNFMLPAKNNVFLGVPYAGAGKALADGIGYSGEGDVMTAALCSVFMREYQYVSPTEMYCPDWRDGTVYLSRHGEQNPRCVDGKPVFSMVSSNLTSDLPALALTGPYRSGKVLLLSLAPQYEDRFTLIAAPGEMLAVSPDCRHRGRVHGWFKPERPLVDFLGDYSKKGGIHHNLLIYDGDIRLAEHFARFSGFDFCRI